MKKLFISFLLVSAVAYTAYSQNIETNLASDNDQWQTLDNENYSIQYPSNWVADENDEYGSKFILYSPIDQGNDVFRENINLMIQDLTGYNLNFYSYVDLSVRQILTMLEDSEILFNENLTANGRKYHKIIYTGKQGELELQFEQYAWVINNEAYVLTLTTEQTAFEKFKASGETILSSFVIK